MTKLELQEVENEEQYELEEETSKDKLINNRYKVIGLLGHGAQGETLEAIDTKTEHSVAVKKFFVRGAKEWKDVELAEREAKVLSIIDHPKLPKYIDHFEEDGCLYIVTQKIHGTPLSSENNYIFDQEELFNLLLDISSTLEYLHSRTPPIIHRDIKPSNIIKCKNGTYSLVDFGSVQNKLNFNGGSTVVGTFGYMAPEQFQGRATAATDVYSLGVTLVQLATGLEPENFPHNGLEIDVDKLLTGVLDDKWIKAIKEMINPNPDNRVKNINSLIERIKYNKVEIKRDSKLKLYFNNSKDWFYKNITFGLIFDIILMIFIPPYCIARLLSLISGSYDNIDDLSILDDEVDKRLSNHKKSKGYGDYLDNSSLFKEKGFRRAVKDEVKSQRKLNKIKAKQQIRNNKENRRQNCSNLHYYFN